MTGRISSALRGWRRIWKPVLVVLCLSFLFPAAAIVLDGLTDDAGKSDVAIVLGSKVEPDGRPSQRLAARLDRALELYRQGLVRHLIVSGGTGAEGFDEAKVMKSYLAARRVPAAAILVDSAGTTTWETARNSAALMRAHGFKSALIVTQYFHISRTRLALQKFGITTIHTAHPSYFEWRDLYSIAREVVGFASYMLRAADSEPANTAP